MTWPASLRKFQGRRTANPLATTGDHHCGATLRSGFGHIWIRCCKCRWDLSGWPFGDDIFDIAGPVGQKWSTVYSGASSKFNQLNSRERLFLSIYCILYWEFSLNFVKCSFKGAHSWWNIFWDGNPEGPSRLPPSVKIVITQRAGYFNVWNRLDMFDI